MAARVDDPNEERLIAFTPDEFAGWIESGVGKREIPDTPFWVGVCGAPGSGKSTICAQLTQCLGDARAVSIPMDGYHYSRRELDAMPDPQEAHRRRGAPFTFDAERFVRDLELARQFGSGRFPSFDHATADPVESSIMLERSHRFVFIEGNYLLLDTDPWRRLRGLFDLTVFLEVDRETCRERLMSRFLEVGLDMEAAAARVAGNDMKNLELVAATRCRADRAVKIHQG